MSKPLRMLYILAPSFSGSTLLTYLLAWHPKVATIGELKATQMGDVDVYRCSCGELIVRCAFWEEVANACRQRGMDFDVHDFGTSLPATRAWTDRLLRADVRGAAFEAVRRAAIGLWPGARRRLTRFLERNRILSEAITEIQQGSVFLDGSKDSTRLLHFMESGRWDMRVINLQRDGRGVSASIAKHGDIAFERGAEHWERNMRGLMNMRRRLQGSEVFDLKYEELCSSPAETLREVFTWLGLEDAPIATSDFKRGDFHILGNTMRLNDISAIRLDEKWRDRVEADRLEAFQRRYRAIQERLGYIHDE